MINELFGQVAITFFIGTLMGVVDEWNRKVMFFIIMVITVLTIILAFIVGMDNIYSEAYPWWRSLFGMFFVAIGMKAGSTVYKGIFK